MALGPDGDNVASGGRVLFKRSRPATLRLADEKRFRTPNYDCARQQYVAGLPAMVYTDYRAWYSHFALTPFASRRKRELADFFSPASCLRDGMEDDSYHRSQG